MGDSLRHRIRIRQLGSTPVSKAEHAQTVRTPQQEQLEQLEQLARTWDDLGTHDPFWAVSSLPEKRGGRWKLADFMATGEQDVSRYAALVALRAGMDRPAAVLDFGCGVGRLTAAWAARAGHVTGVDISEPMLALARQTLENCRNVSFVLNRREDLNVFADESFDLVFSLICLQHMPWELARSYINEFARVVSSGGTVAFQLPARQVGGNRAARIRRAVVDALGTIGRIYRQIRHGSPVIFDMHFTPPATVVECAAAAGLELMHQEPDGAAGPDTEGFFYIFRKR